MSKNKQDGRLTKDGQIVPNNCINSIENALNAFSSELPEDIANHCKYVSLVFQLNRETKKMSTILSLNSKGFGKDV